MERRATRRLTTLPDVRPGAGMRQPTPKRWASRLRSLPTLLGPVGADVVRVTLLPKVRTQRVILLFQFVLLAYPVLIAKQSAKQRAAFQQVMPILRGTCQPAHLKSQNQTNSLQGDFAQQTLKSNAMFGAAPAQFLIHINDQNTLPRPAERHRMTRQVILPFVSRQVNSSWGIMVNNRDQILGRRVHEANLVRATRAGLQTTLGPATTRTKRLLRQRHVPVWLTTEL